MNMGAEGESKGCFLGGRLDRLVLAGHGLMVNRCFDSKPPVGQLKSRRSGPINVVLTGAGHERKTLCRRHTASG
jgi:hypothetical protein